MLLSCLKRDCVMGEIRCAKYSKEDTLELRVRFLVLQLLTNCWAELTAGFEIRQTSGRSRKRIKRGEMVISGTYCDVASQSMFFQFFPDIHPFPGIRMLLFSWNFAGEFKWAISRLLGEQGIQRQGEWIVSGEDTSRWGRDPLLVPADRAWPPLLTPSVSICSLLLCMGCTPGIFSVSGLGFTSFPKFWICIHPLPKSCTWIYLKSTCLPGFGSQFFSNQGIIQLILCPLIRSHP